MGASFRLEGDVAKLRHLGAALKEAGDKETKREFYKAIQRATKPVKEEIKQSARDTLPHGGGLNEWVAAIGIKTKQSYSGRMPGITITGALDNKSAVRRSGGKRSKSRKSGTFGARADLRAINRGRVMHPAWGHGPLVGPQMVTPGFWDKPFKGIVARRATKEIRRAMADVAKQVERRMNSAA
jgi:hypothetical protein